jgi:trehalose utilization protein
MTMTTDLKMNDITEDLFYTQTEISRICNNMGLLVYFSTHYDVIANNLNGDLYDFNWIID